MNILKTPGPSFEANLEPCAAISIEHLRRATIDQLGRYGVCYANDYGGFYYVAGVPGADDGTEDLPADLATVVLAARAAGLVWVKFDADAQRVPGLPVYTEEAIASD